MARRQTTSPPTQNTQTAERFEYVLRARFAGNQSRMAEQLGVSQSFLSRVLNRRKEAGSKLLKALSQLPGINEHWVLTGEGKPLQAEPSSTVPVARELLPGPPTEHSSLLTGATESVAAHHARDTVYMIVVAEPQFEHMMPGDRLLLDTDHRQWKKNLRLLDRKLCAVRRSTSSGNFIELCRIHCESDATGETIQLREYVPHNPKLEIDPHYGKAYRPDPTADPANPPSSEVEESSQTFCVISVEDIVAVALELFRRL